MKAKKVTEREQKLIVDLIKAGYTNNQIVRISGRSMYTVYIIRQRYLNRNLPWNAWWKEKYA